MQILERAPGKMAQKERLSGKKDCVDSEDFDWQSIDQLVRIELDGKQSAMRLIEKNAGRFIF